VKAEDKAKQKTKFFVFFVEAPPIFGVSQISESREEYQTKYEVFVFFVEAHYSFSICVSV